MWIRSQYKDNLIKAKSIGYYHQREEIKEEIGKTTKWRGFKVPEKEIVGYKEHHYIVVNNIFFGTYSTKEKALKVIDLIQKQIINNETIYAHAISGSGVRNYNVFQMPKDEEVEENG